MKKRDPSNSAGHTENGTIKEEGKGGLDGRITAGTRQATRKLKGFVNNTAQKRERS